MDPGNSTSFPVHISCTCVYTFGSVFLQKLQNKKNERLSKNGFEMYRGYLNTWKETGNTDWKGDAKVACEVNVDTSSVFAWPRRSEAVFSLALDPVNDYYFATGGSKLRLTFFVIYIYALIYYVVAYECVYTRMQQVCASV